MRRLVLTFFSISLLYDVVSACGSNWLKVLETDSTGKVVFGSKSTLMQAVESGSKIRFITGSYSADTHNAYVYNDQVCAQSLFHISKNGWDKHQTSAYWWFLNLCTTGHVHMSRWYVGSHSQPSQPESKVRYDIKWFVRHLGCDTSLPRPVLSNTRTGQVINGSTNALSNAINNGAEVYVTDTDRKYATKLSNIVHNKENTMVSGTALWHVSQTTSSTHIEFQQNVYWWFTLWSSDGSRDVSRWSVGEHTDRGHTNDKLAMNWFVDACWTLAYEHDENGSPIDGSLDFLRSAVLAGRRVRLVYYDNYVVEADVLFIRNGHITVQVLAHVSKADMKTFQSNSYWYWENVATTGNVEIIRYNVGSTTSRGTTKQRQRVKWFIDTRPWKHAYSNSENGSVVHGSKASLIQNVKEGKMLRFTVKLSGDSSNDYAFVLEADNLSISPDGNDIGAQHVRFVSVQTESLSNLKFHANPYWNFIIATTSGKVDESRWTIGKHESRGQVTSTASIDWFVS